jgi:two-component system sensor histidine kinase TctE
LRRLLATDPRHRQGSLFGEIVDWLLAPFLILWPLSMALEYALAYQVATAAYDRELAETATEIARQVTYDRERVRLDLPTAAEALLTKAHGGGQGRYQVRGLKNEIVAGDARLPLIDFQAETEPRTVYFRKERVDDQDVRVAHLYAQVHGMPGAVLVQVAEAEDKRIELAGDISGAVLASQFALLPLALLMVSFGLSKGIAPLDELRAKIRDRVPGDLSPIDPANAPEEVRPFIDSINELMTRLEASMRSQQRFVADAAHQMRTPLAGLKTQAELALRQHDAKGIEHAMRQIAFGADRASRLVNQLLALAQADNHARPLTAPLDLGALARETAREWVPQAMERRIDLGFEGAGVPCILSGNATLLRELISNLLDNAIRYTPDGGRVTLRVADAGRGIELSVEDDGIGIAPAERELVFERFYRVLGTDSEGSGLGLAIVREIAAAHGGSVRAESPALGRGTLLRVMLPRAAGTLRRVA